MAFSGNMYGNGHDVISESFAAGEDIPFGAPVFASGTERVVNLSGDKFAGVALRAGALGKGGYAEQDAVTVAITGKVYVVAGDDINVGQRIEVDATDGFVPTNVGQEIGTARSSASAGELFVIQLDFTPGTNIEGDK